MILCYKIYQIFQAKHWLRIFLWEYWGGVLPGFIFYCWVPGERCQPLWGNNSFTFILSNEIIRFFSVFEAGRVKWRSWVEPRKTHSKSAHWNFSLMWELPLDSQQCHTIFLWNWADTIFYFQCCLWNYGVKKAMNIHFAHFHKLRFVMLQIAWQNLRNRASSGKSNAVIECLSAFWVREND